VLREEFRAIHDERRPAEVPPRRLLVTFGGADRRDLTARALAAVERLATPLDEVVVVVGSLHGRLSGVRAQIERMHAVRVRLAVDTNDMPRLMADSDVALSSGGLTAWELACAGVPNLIVSSTDRERETAELLAREGYAYFVGHHTNVTAEHMREALDRLASAPERARAFAAAGRLLVDGRGLERVVRSIRELAEQGTVSGTGS
jgi:spore coat polysaccharide biosynthesis predicted glycosyltransferase SpsG